MQFAEVDFVISPAIEFGSILNPCSLLTRSARRPAQNGEGDVLNSLVFKPEVEATELS